MQEILNNSTLQEFLDYKVLGSNLWLLVGLPVAVMVSTIIAATLIGLIKKVLKKLLSFTRLKSDEATLVDLVSPTRLLIAVFIFKAMKGFLELSKETISNINDVERTVIIFAVVWFGFEITDGFVKYATRSLKKSKNNLALTALPLLRRTVKIIMAIIGILVLLQNFGVNVGAIVAGLGIGGLAFALAAQKTIENLFGGVVLILDQPFKIGDTCKFGGVEGAIEEIGLRSTTLRTPDRTVVTVPNSELSQSKIENLTERDKFLIQANVNISVDTGSDKLESALQKINSALQSYKEIEKETARARLIKFGEYFLTIEIFAYAKFSDFATFIAFRERVYLEVIATLEAAGCKLNQRPL